MNPAREVRDIGEEDKGDGAGSGNFVPLSGSISNPRVLSDMGLASSLPVDFNEFAKYLEKERKRNWKQILCYAQNYAHVLTTGSAKDLLTLSSSQRKHAMEALAALSKFTGCKCGDKSENRTS